MSLDAAKRRRKKLNEEINANEKREKNVNKRYNKREEHQKDLESSLENAMKEIEREAKRLQTELGITERYIEHNQGVGKNRLDKFKKVSGRVFKKIRGGLGKVDWASISGAGLRVTGNIVGLSVKGLKVFDVRTSAKMAGQKKGYKEHLISDNNLLGDWADKIGEGIIDSGRKMQGLDDLATVDKKEANKADWAKEGVTSTVDVLGQSIFKEFENEIVDKIGKKDFNPDLNGVLKEVAENIAADLNGAEAAKVERGKVIEGIGGGAKKDSYIRRMLSAYTQNMGLFDPVESFSLLSEVVDAVEAADPKSKPRFEKIKKKIENYKRLSPEEEKLWQQGCGILFR